MYGHELEPGAWLLGEDSGLEVAALGGAPGIRSARYAPEGLPAIERLLRELGDEQDRRARYVCELVLIGPDGRELRGTGTLDGRISVEPRGTEGFGYDPVFVPDGEEKTVAEIGNAWKAENSHRARAAKALVAQIDATRPGRRPSPRRRASCGWPATSSPRRRRPARSP